jgi:hypothetical protein
MRKLAGVQYRVDPTSANIPGLSANLERGLFTTLEKFRFADGPAFDFRGVPERSVKSDPERWAIPTSARARDSRRHSRPS